MGNNCFCNVHLRQFNFQQLEQIGMGCFCGLSYYGEICFSYLTKTGLDCFQNLVGVTKLQLPKIDILNRVDCVSLNLSKERLYDALNR